MSWTRIAAVLATLTMLGAWQAASLAQNAVPPRLQAILDGFRSQGTPDQYKQVADAITASPALARQLGDLAQAGRLTGFEIATPQRKQSSPFATTIDHGRIVFAGDFLAQVVKKRLYDVVTADQILPNNLVFVLGSFAYQLQNPGAQGQPAPSDMASFVKAHLEKDTRSFIQGWDDVVDAAVKENGSKPLTVQQQGMLVLNLRYRILFLDKDSQRKIAFSPSGAIDPTGQNVAAVMAIVVRTSLLDFGVGLGE